MSFGLDLDKPPQEVVDEVSERADDIWHIYCRACWDGTHGLCGERFVHPGGAVRWFNSPCPMCQQIVEQHMPCRG